MNVRPTAAVPRASGPGEGADPAASPALQWAVAHGAVDEVCMRVAARLRQRRRRRMGAAAGLLGVVAAGFLWWRMPAALPERPGTSPAASVAGATAPRLETLPDGTVVELREGARLAVAFTAAARRVELQAGEAHFQVVSDPQRPFVVTAGGVDVRAVGTAFAVQLGTREVEVLVTEGKVAVEQAAPALRLAGAAPAHHYASVAAGGRVVVDTGRAPAPAPVVALTSSEMAARLAWRVPRLELAGTSLERTLALFNQHSSPRLRLADPQLGRLELSGVIRADNADSLLRLLRAEFGISAEYHDTEIVLRRSR